MDAGLHVFHRVCMCWRCWCFYLQDKAYRSRRIWLIKKKMSFAWSNKTHHQRWACVGVLDAGNKQVLENDSEFFFFFCSISNELPALLNEWTRSTFPRESPVRPFSHRAPQWVTDWLSVCRGTFPKPPVLSWTKVPLFFHSSPLSAVSREHISGLH